MHVASLFSRSGRFIFTLFLFSSLASGGLQPQLRLLLLPPLINSQGLFFITASALIHTSFPAGSSFLAAPAFARVALPSFSLAFIPYVSCSTSFVCCVLPFL